MSTDDEALAHLRRFLSGPHFLQSVRACHLSYPTPELEGTILDVLADEFGLRRVPLEIEDLRTSPGSRLEGVATHAWPEGRPARGAHEPGSPIKAIALLGFDLLEGPGNHQYTRPFRSKFQFDEANLWVFLGQDRRRLVRMFQAKHEPLLGASIDLTPPEWRL